MAKHTIRKGDTVFYSDPNLDGRLNRAICQGHGWHKGRRIVYLNNGHWCYHDDVASEVGSQIVPVVPRAASSACAGVEQALARQRDEAGPRVMSCRRTTLSSSCCSWPKSWGWIPSTWTMRSMTWPRKLAWQS
jgi:hypothetical protein